MARNSQKKKHALVTGGAGFVGSHLVRGLLSAGYNVSVVDNLSTGKKSNIDARAAFHKRDICNFKSITPLFKGVRYVFHVAALPKVPLSVESPLLTNKHNIEGTLNVLQAAREAKVKRVVYSASSSAYGNQKTLPLHEAMQPNPVSPYGLQKLTGEALSRLYSELYGLETVSLRYFNVYGEGMPLSGPYSACLAIFMAQASKGEPLTVLGGKQTRDFTYVGDVVRANLLAARAKSVGRGEVINIGGGQNYSIAEIAGFISNDVSFLPQRQGEPMHTRADIRKAKRLLGWSPKISLRDWLRRQKA